MAETPDAAVRRLIAEHRAARGMTQTDLARQVTALGTPMRQTTVSKIEDGTRKVGVDELFAIAVALDVSPLVLMVPFDTEDPYRVAIGHEHYPWLVYEWCVGTEQLTDKPGMWTALDFYAPVRAAQLELHRLERQQATDTPAYTEALQRLADASYDMERAGLPCEGLVRGWQREARRRGIRPRPPRKRIEEELGSLGKED